jgi:hypothetical protein
MLDVLDALIKTAPTDWRAIAKYHKALGWQFDRNGQLPDVIGRKQFKPGPGLVAYLPQAIWIQMGFSIGFVAALNIIHARQGAASTQMAPPSQAEGN